MDQKNRTTVTSEELRTFTFPLTDADVLRIVGEVNELKSEEASLKRKKDLIHQEMKKTATKADQKLNDIAHREEEREVPCKVVYDYEKRVIDVTYDGQIMESRTMSNWEYDSRPSDVFPKTVEKKEKTEEPVKTAIEAAMERADEIADKEAKNQTPSANVREFSEAKTEKSTIITADNL